MVVYPLAAAFVLLWLALCMRNADNGVPVTVAMLPFGMFAALVAGGLSIIIANLLAILTIGLLLVRWVSQRRGVPQEGLPTAGLCLLLFSGYALFSGFVLVRLFEGQFLVFPMSVSSKGTQVSVFYPSTMWPLSPGNSNIAQSFYILLSTGFFLTCVFVMRRRGLGFVLSGLVAAGVINLVLGLADFAQLDPLLALIRTADYNLNNHHTVSGFARIIGGFAEASGFGAASSAFFGFFAMSFLVGHGFRDGVLAFASLACALMALSSTAMLSLAAALLLIVLHAPVYLSTGMSRVFGHVFIIALAVAALVGCLVFLLTPAADLTSDILDRLVLSKGDSLSGLERGAWAQSGIDAFFNTWGMGAGVGSLRANGFATVLLGSVGVPGTLAFAGFLTLAFGRGIGPAPRDTKKAFYAARIGALTLFASMLVSATVPDPTLFLVAFASICVVARETAARTQRPRAGSATAGFTAGTSQAPTW
ncbi:hypothetical protein [Sulfitobacter sabulilitoris]|uniref:O-antigen ligase family protein n=1 Tax=Sulfitobacter sabulilitoris TaxID=2562655 RepID=A0A5S3Q3F2_9RHOB|nr:hypothetical protein [Sulfitobacter sabulilitoris]TMM51051.1 hypothetical protein FDT80_14365 [Sulfitobacter sabulilitoris]